MRDFEFSFNDSLEDQSIKKMNKKRSKDYTSYVKQDDKYVPVGEATNELPVGYYKPVHNQYDDKTYLLQRDIVKPNLYTLPNKIQASLIRDIKKFWESEERYRKFGSVYKRNILMYSTPGNGKTSLINLICGEIINKYNGIVITIDSIQDLTAYPLCMDRLRSIEPKRKVITIIEDFERLTKNEENASLLLQILDGNKQYDNVVTIATTNHPEILEKQFVCRPSRFNIVIEYQKPNKKTRKAYIEKKLKDGGIDVENEEVKKDIERLAVRTNGFTFDFVKEAIQGIYIDAIEENAVFKRLEDIINRNGKVVISEEDVKKIGFGSSSQDDDDDDDMDDYSDLEELEYINESHRPSEFYYAD